MSPATPHGAPGRAPSGTAGGEEDEKVLTRLGDLRRAGDYPGTLTAGFEGGTVNPSARIHLKSGPCKV